MIIIKVIFVICDSGTHMKSRIPVPSAACVHREIILSFMGNAAENHGAEIILAFVKQKSKGPN